MTGEIKLEKECVKMTHRTFVLFLVAVISLVGSAAWFLANMNATMVRIEAKQDMMVSGCCPDEFKKLFGMCDKCKPKEVKDAL